MNKDYGEIEISEGFVVGNYYNFSKEFDDDVSEVSLKYLGEKDGYKKFLDEDELDVVEFSGSRLESCVHDIGVYTILSNKNVLTWRILSVNFHCKYLILELSKDGHKTSTTVSLDHEIRKLAKNIGVNL